MSVENRDAMFEGIRVMERLARAGALGVLQCYVDERAHRHAEAHERSWPGPAQDVLKAKLDEAVEIGRQIARMVKEAS